MNILPDHIFFADNTLDRSRTGTLIKDALLGMDDGELFLEYCQSESLVLDDGKLKNASFNTSQGFGLRSVLGETVGYAHSSELSEEAIRRATETVRSIQHGQTAVQASHQPQFGSNIRLYGDINPLQELAFEKKVALLKEIDSYARDQDPRVRQVSASLSGSWQAITIMRGDGESVSDIRPLVRINVSIVLEEGERMESGSSGAGGRTSYAHYISQHDWQAQVGEALRQARVNMESKPAPAGEMPVILGPGWCGVLLHEAVGHGLEGDFNRKGTSAFAGLMGKQVASKGITVIDDGTMMDRRGSLTIDDEGTPTSKTTLIDDGMLTGYMQDRLNARLMGTQATGNGRRESYAHQPMPRMTNTYMLNGTTDPKDMITSIKRGIYATHFGGGQVDITSGKFVFSATEAYLVENGEVKHPVKGATLIGDGPSVLKRVTAIGNDMALDPGIGTCGKAGQGVPVGVGQPSLLVDKLTVGGTEAA